MTESEQHDEKLSTLYKKTGNIEPPARLDQVILAASKQPAGSRSRSIPPKADYWRWPAALASMAAAVVISVLIVPLILEDEQHDEAASYGYQQADRVESVEEKPSAPVASSAPAEPQRAPVADKMNRQLSSPGKAMQEPEFRARMKQESRAMESDDMFSAPAGMATEAPVPADGWMEAILQLAAEGKYRQAADELAQFILAHPDYRVDESLIHTLEGKIGPTPPVPGTVK